MNKNIKVSFDFDDTLSRLSVQNFVRELNNKFDIWIVTSRLETINNEDLFSVANFLNIKNIVFTNLEWKFIFFKDKDFLCHFDDFSQELDLINQHTKTVGISVWKNNMWKRKFRHLLLQNNIM